MDFSRKELLHAIDEIKRNPSLKSGRHSSTYDLIFEGEKYPPILVLSVANKLKGLGELTLSDFKSNVEIPFKILKENGFKIIEKMREINFWIEKTITKKRIDRLEGERALGKALWSPQKGQSGADIYKNMRLVKKGDYILHLVDNSSIAGISIVKNKAVETIGIEGTEWDGPAYLITLENYTPLKIPLSRTDILKLSNKNILENISKTNEVFYNKKLDLRQGAYLTPCPIELLELINTEYYKLNSENIPLIKLNSRKVNNITNEFNCKPFHQYTKDVGLVFSEKLITRFVSSLLTKPFVLLTGLSGSGKTKIAQSFVKWICEDEHQYKIIPVGADWTNREPLLGYPNGLNPEEYITSDSGALNLIIEASKIENAEKPYFLILDEMNLSHVERYFADFLSVTESDDKISLYSGAARKDLEKNDIPKDIFWSKNLFIIGTVNIDETTYMFSPKVLDRANTIEFRVDENNIKSFLDLPSKIDLSVLESKGASMAKSFLEISRDNIIEKDDEYSDILVKFFNELKKVGAEFGYRTAVEILLLIKKLNTISEVSKNECIDIAVMQKLLPKLHGSRSKISKVLDALILLCLKEGQTFAIAKSDEVVAENINYPIAFEKLVRMYKNALDNGFTSYAEA